jgi:hypothetical protein
MATWMTPAKKEFNNKAKNGGMNRETRRKFLKDLALEASRATMPDMAKDYRANRKAKRQRANATRNRNRRLSK